MKLSLELVDQLLTPAETSALLKIPESTLAVWRSTHRVASPPYIKLGRHVRYRQSAVRDYLTRNTIECGSSSACA